jgi:S1-C subfamily serine protease/endonuclease YncB( thermonuclease family)
VIRGLALLLLCAATVFALEPKEVYDRAAPATVFLTTRDGTGSGIVLDVPKGYVLTNEHVARGSREVEVLLKNGEKRTGKVIASDPELDLALLAVEGLIGTGTRSLALAPAVKAADDLKATRVYAIGHPADPTDKISMWKFTRGIVSNVRALAVVEMKGLVLIEHDATLSKGNSGGPLMDSEARLVGVNATMWAELSGRSANTYYSIPINAVRKFLEVSGHTELGELPAGVLRVFDPSVLREAPTRRTREPLPRVAIPKGLRFGPYVHSYESREKRSLNARVTRMMGGLRGLFTRCETCEAKGSIRELVREGYWANRVTWVPPVYRARICPTCEGQRKLFHVGKGEKVFAEFTRPQTSAAANFVIAKERWLQRLHATQSTFKQRVTVNIQVQGRYGLVNGAASNPLFPLHFVLLPVGKKYEWFLHSELLNGRFRYGSENGTVPAQARIVEVVAGDLLVLATGQPVRICGITIPLAGGKLAKPDLMAADEVTRGLVRKELLGKTVKLISDKYSRITLDGHAIAFVELDGKDYGLELIRRGIARRHPKHGHERFARYKKAAAEAQKAKVGIWKKD